MHGTWSDMGSAVILHGSVHNFFLKYIFFVLLRVYRFVFITVLMYNPLWKIVMGPYAACKGGGKLFY
jgi:hypothetical protein